MREETTTKRRIVKEETPRIVETRVDPTAHLRTSLEEVHVARS